MNSGTLLLSPHEEDLSRLRQILGLNDWVADSASTCHEARGILNRRNFLVLICECQLPDGNWKDMLESVAAIADPPRLVVMSRFADEALWAEVLNLGGHDVLAKPFETDEVLRVVGKALFGHTASV